MNRGALRTQAATFAGDPSQTRYADIYNTAINRAQEQFALDTRALWKDQSYTTTANDATYALPSDFMYEDWITYDGKELMPISRHDMQRLYGKDWATLAGTPTHVIIDPEEAQKMLLLVPIPQEVKTVGLRYYPLPAELTADSDTPLNASLLMAQFHMGIAAFVGWLCLMSETSTPEISAKQVKLLGVYQDAADKATNLFNNTTSAGMKIRGSRFMGVNWD